MANNPIQFWISFNNGAEKIRLPVNPDKISVSVDHGYEDFDVTQFGEFTVIGKSKAPEISFSSFFPFQYNSSYCEYQDFPEPWFLIGKLREWQESGRPMRLNITGTPINKAVTIRSFTFDAEKGGEVGDIYFNITFKEYFFVNFRKVGQASAGSVSSGEFTFARPNDTTQVTSHTVAQGDTLWLIASRATVYGDGDQWTKIYTANRKLIGADPNLITHLIGQKLVIPR